MVNKSVKIDTEPPWCRFVAPCHTQCPRKQSLPAGSCLRHKQAALLCRPEYNLQIRERKIRKERSGTPISTYMTSVDLGIQLGHKVVCEDKKYPAEANAKLSGTDFTRFTENLKGKVVFPVFCCSIQKPSRANQSQRTRKEFQTPLYTIPVVVLAPSLCEDGLPAELCFLAQN